MLLIPYEMLDAGLKNKETRMYYDLLCRKKGSLFIKRAIDIIGSCLLLILFSPVIAVFSVIIKCDSKGPVFFRQIRVSRYGSEFRIFKFRTMVVNAESLGTQVTTDRDPRITKVGNVIRKFRIDEIPQLINILKGDMSFVGTRPEVPRYVAHYTDEMKATLLMPQGLTSPASLAYKDEDKLLNGAEDADRVYVEQILPEKMKYNLQYMKDFGPFTDIKIMVQTVADVLLKRGA